MTYTEVVKAIVALARSLGPLWDVEIKGRGTRELSVTVRRK